MRPPLPPLPKVNAEATKIAKEAAEANAIKTQVQAELDKALPALQVGGPEGLPSWANTLHNPRRIVLPHWAVTLRQRASILEHARSPRHPAPPPRPPRRR